MSLLTSIQKTVKYFAFFDYPFSIEDLHYWLISSKKYSISKVASVIKKETISELSPNREELRDVSNQKILLAKKLGHFFSNWPFICMIAITGSVAAKNAKPDDDIDVMVITKRNTLWIVRPFFLLALSLCFKRRRPGQVTDLKNTICPNLWLAEDAIKIQKKRRNQYTAHEILQVVPLLDRDNTYHLFIKKNQWTKRYYANAYHSVISKLGKKFPRHSVEYQNILVVLLNYLLYALQVIYMLPNRTTEETTIRSAFLHTINYSKKIKEYNQ